MAPPVITSLLDTDLYKFTMWQAMLHRFSATRAHYSFLCRNTPQFPLADLLPALDVELDRLCSLRFQPDELAYLGSLRFIKSDFVDFLRIFQFQRDFIRASAQGDRLVIEAEGPQVHVMAFEVFVLAIVNELYFRRFDATAALAEGRRRLDAKLATLRDLARRPPRAHLLELFDFGVRRRFSGAWQREVVGALAQAAPEMFKGTSNVRLARDLGLTPIGTMAHEYLQTFQALGVRLRDFQRAALESWVQEYRGDLGIALTDVVGMDAFLADFDLYFAKLFDTYELELWTRNPELPAPWTQYGARASECFLNEEGGEAVGWATNVVHAFKAGGKAFPPCWITSLNCYRALASRACFLRSGRCRLNNRRRRHLVSATRGFRGSRND